MDALIITLTVQTLLFTALTLGAMFAQAHDESVAADAAVRTAKLRRRMTTPEISVESGKTTARAGAYRPRSRFAPYHRRLVSG